MQLNKYQVDAITEVINIGVGRAANSLSEMTGSPIELNVPSIHISGTPEFSKVIKTLELNVETTIQQIFEGELSGRALLSFSRENALKMACLVGDITTTNTEMDEELTGVLEEVGNIVLNAVLGSIANVLNCPFSYELPEFCSKNTFSTIIHKYVDDVRGSEAIALIVNTSFTVAGKNLSGAILVLFDSGDIETILSVLTADMAV